MSDTMDDAADRSGRDRGHDEPAPGFGARVALFYRQVIAELRKVIWPTRTELLTYTAVVIVFVVAMAAIVGVFDFFFTKGVLAVFGS